jgi:hypothetical protein
VKEYGQLSLRDFDVASSQVYELEMNEVLLKVGTAEPPYFERLLA